MTSELGASPAPRDSTPPLRFADAPGLGPTALTPRRDRFPIVGIGASAGGLRALQRLLGHLADDTGMALVVVVHLDPHHASHMAELLQASCAMPVTQVGHSLAVERNHVYIIPPDKDLAMVDGELRVSARTDGPRGRTPIDLFFRSLADTHDVDAIGVVLSGTGADGAQGVRWIKERGGVTMAQTPADADFDGMPRSAIATGQVDIVLPAAELGVELARLSHAASTITLPADGEELEAGEMSALGQVLGHVRRSTGRDFAGYKHGTVLRRLERRMQFSGTTSLADYLKVLRDSPDETSALCNDFLICVTSFFRDPEAFDALEREVVPALFADKNRDDDVRVWVAGCATGEEAYSLAILLSEYAGRLDDPPRIQVFATDVHERSFVFAREGLYPESIAAMLSPARLARFFTREPTGFRIKKAIRERVMFATHDLLSDPPFLRLDLISCRNVLIYLQRDTQQRLLDLFHFALRPGGYLFLGSSESAEAVTKLFVPVDKQRHIYRASREPHAVPPRPPQREPIEPRLSSVARASHRPPIFSFGALHQQLVEAYAPPSLVVNAELEVVHISGHAGRYLRHAGGVPTNKLLDMVHGDLRLRLRTLLRSALRTEAPAEARDVRFDVDGKHRHIDLSVRPLTGLRAEGAFLLVVFDEHEATRAPAAARASASRTESERLARLEQLEQELQETRTRLAATSEEHEATIEALRASNEELQSTTEEQLAVSEELEASKEELQSINEELRTINQEHRIRNEELAEVNADLANLIDSTDIGTVFLDRELRIRRYTPPVAGVFNFVPTDVGRPLAHVTHRLDYPGLEDDLRGVLQARTRTEREVPSNDGRWFMVRLSPYRSLEDSIEGAVLTLVDTTARKHAELDREALLKRAEESSTSKSNFIHAMSHEFRTPLNAILGYAEILREGAVGPVTGDQREKLERIATNAKHLEGMVTEILETALGELQGIVPECRPADLAELVRLAASAIESLAQAKGLTLGVDVPAGALPVVTDPRRLRQVLFNLLGNAIRYTDAGSVQVRARLDDAAAVIEIQDTGIGIAPEHRERIFERFWQVDQSHTRKRGGTGLGLLVTRDLVRALGGEVEVESEVGRGSLFRVRLPRDSSTHIATRAAARLH